MTYLEKTRHHFFVLGKIDAQCGAPYAQKTEQIVAFAAYLFTGTPEKYHDKVAEFKGIYDESRNSEALRLARLWQS